MVKVIAVAGPTASGKSALAVALAKELDGEVISADSMQVYRGMDIGTAKIRQEEMEGIPHHLIDIQDYSEPWNVREFQKQCRRKIEEITSRGRIPIICGGTGLYIKAALYDYEFVEEKEDPETAQKLEKLSNSQLYELLEQKDPQALEKIHINNRKRLLRAAMIASSGISKTRREQVQKHEPVYDIFIAGLQDSSRQRETERISKRVDDMFENGLENEVKSLFSDPASWNYTSFAGIGYKEFKDYFTGEANLDQIKSNIVIHTRQYSRRQMTWFRNQLPVHWFDAGHPEQVISEVKKWL